MTSTAGDKPDAIAARAARRVRRLAWAQWLLASATFFLALLGGWSPLLQTEVTHLAAFFAVLLALVVAFGHRIKPSSGAVTARERAMASHEKTLLNWLLPLGTLLLPCFAALLLVFTVYPPGAACKAVLDSQLLGIESSSVPESGPPLGEMVWSIRGQLQQSPPRGGWSPKDPESLHLIRETVISTLEGRAPARLEAPAPEDLPAWVKSSVELALLQSAPRFWKLAGLQYNCLNPSDVDRLHEILMADAAYYTTKEPVTVTCKEGATDQDGKPRLEQGHYLACGSVWQVWLLIDARSVRAAATYQVDLQDGGGLYTIDLPADNAGHWFVWSRILTQKPGTEAELKGSNTIKLRERMPAALRELLPGVTAKAFDFRQEFLASQQFTIALVEGAPADAMSIMQAKAPNTSVLIVAADDTEAKWIDEQFVAKFETVEHSFGRDVNRLINDQLGNLRIHPLGAFATAFRPVERAQLGKAESIQKLYVPKDWKGLEVLCRWSATFPGFFWEDIERSFPNWRAVHPLVMRATAISGLKPVIGYIVALPQGFDPAAAATSQADRELLWSVLNECALRLLMDRLMMAQGLQNLGVETGEYVPVMRAEDLLRVSSGRVRRDLTIVLGLLFLYAAFLTLGRHNISRTQSIPR